MNKESLMPDRWRKGIFFVGVLTGEETKAEVKEKTRSL